MRDLVEKAHDIRRALYGDEHPDVAESLYYLASMSADGERMAECERMHREALAMRQRLLGDDPAVAQSLDGLSVLLVAAGRYEEAAPLLEEAIRIRRERLGPEHFDVARTLTELGEVSLTWGDYRKAEACFREQVRNPAQAVSQWKRRSGVCDFGSWNGVGDARSVCRSGGTSSRGSGDGGGGQGRGAFGADAK